jgi:hypothetical protein
MRIMMRKFKAVDTIRQEPTPAMVLDKNSKFVYKRGSDVMKTFKKYGFVPPTEYRNDYLFKKNREAGNE